METSKKIKVGVVLGGNLGQVRPNVVKKVKKWALSIGFFFIFTCGIPYKAKSSGSTNIWVEIEGNTARNAMFEQSFIN